MADSEFIKLFREKREEFERYLQQRDHKAKEGRGKRGRSSERLLDWFEKWLESEGRLEEQRKFAPAMPFDEFLNRVMERAVKILGEKDPGLGDFLSAQAGGGATSWKLYSKNWKVLNAFKDPDVFYRIGKTTPRKGSYQGRELVVIELVLDGRKKQAFLPMLDRKPEMEEKLGAVLERELPRVEATGKYRFKLFLPYELAHSGDVEAVAGKMAEMVLATRPVLNELGIA
ncbi:MAG: hypothetical protein K6T29_00425 [Peptococcaceae bacterium]|nr:hypothetical protein [Peptococcaceae bacterium]